MRMLGAEMETQPHRRPKRDNRRRRGAPNRPARRISPERRAALAEARRAAPITIDYPAELPVSQRKDDIAEAIAKHQVVIVAGETGSGKTTQLPKICMELGRGVDGLIGHTQPRRIAARSVADRIAGETRTELGTGIGFQVRFSDQVSDSTRVKVMTDGILLTEIANDRELRAYDTIIIDEAHERSLNIDFILGCLKQLLPKRPDLKLIITSATIDPERFAKHFDDAPIIEVSGRTYPVETRYRPLLPETGEDQDAEPRDQVQAIVEAVEELVAEGPGDILVFCSGEREIRDAADAIAGLKLRETEILPLYARLSIAEQHRVFASHTGRRIVLATNVAETSLTVPGIKYVIDPGTARISRYSSRLKVQRLPIEPISQASANQRKGRCGRTSNGICIRLYSEDDFNARPEFTDPEILRTNLAGVILQMTAYRLGDIASFPFIDPPDKRNIADGIALLNELGAFTDRRELTPLGRKLAALPIDPRMARMVMEADRNGCVHEVMVIASVLSIPDPRERPTDKQEQADQKHARFKDPSSDFMALLNLWNYLTEQQKALSSNQFRKLCRNEFLNYLRVREWQDLYSQLRQTAKQLQLSLREMAEPDANKIHQSLLAGLLSHIGLKEPDEKSGGNGPQGKRRRFEYLGARGAKFAIAPGSTLFRSTPQWVFAAELVETSRLWARVVSKIEPEWAEALAAHLVKRTYSEPHWSKKQAAVVASEKVLLYGIPLVAARRVNYSRIDPVLSRELFIRHALVEGDWDTRHHFFAANRALLDEVEELEHRARRRDILVDDETLYEFYDRRIPADVTSGRHFDAWWKQVRRDNPTLLDFDLAMLTSESGTAVSEHEYPDALAGLSLRYQFEPGVAADGVTAIVPVARLASIQPTTFDWQVPGLRADLITALIKSLPKAKRVQLVPAPDHAREVLGRVTPGDEPLLDALEREFRRMTGVLIDRSDWDWERVPAYLRMTYRVVDDEGATLAEGKDLAALRAKLAPKTREVVEAVGQGVERDGLTSWTIGTLPRMIEERRGAFTVRAYPALVDEGDSVAVRVFDSPRAAERAMRAGARRLLLLTIPSPIQLISSRLSNDAKLTLMRNPNQNVGALIADCMDASVDALVASAGGPAWDDAAFARLRDHVRGTLFDTAMETISRIRTILGSWHKVTLQTGSVGNLAVAASIADIKAQLSGLIYPGFVTATGADRLLDLARYLRAIERRLEKLPQDPVRDRAQAERIAEVEQEYAVWLTELPRGAADWDEVRDVRWMIEELRVNYFAQALGTPYPISEKRIYKAMDAVSASAAG
jgi:ATP-dependent helicase HrpA